MSVHSRLPPAHMVSADCCRERMPVHIYLIVRLDPRMREQARRPPCSWGGAGVRHDQNEEIKLLSSVAVWRRTSLYCLAPVDPFPLGHPIPVTVEPTHVSTAEAATATTISPYSAMGELRAMLGLCDRCSWSIKCRTSAS